MSASSPSLFLGIAHAAFAPERKETLRRLREALEPPGDREAGIPSLAEQGVTVHVEEDHERSGAWIPSRRAMEAGLRSGAEYVLVANDDMLPCEDLILHVRAVLDAMRGTGRQEHPVAFYANHPAAVEVAEAGGGLYTTHDGLVGVCYALHKSALREFLAWYDESMVAGGVASLSSDTPVCYWAMATGRLLYHTSPSLVDHQCPESSLRGHEDNGFRRPAVLPWDSLKMAKVDWARPAVHAGLRYAGTHWQVLSETRHESWDVENVFRAARLGLPVSDDLHVLIATPAYGPCETAFVTSRLAVREDLKTRGVRSSCIVTDGDALITRGRNALVHEFLLSTATHLLFWDSDVEVMDPSCVYRMLQTRRGLVAGAVPFRNGKGGVVCNPLESDVARKAVEIQDDGCIEVARAGTGFMLISRETILRMIYAHPETFYVSDTAIHLGRPMWALFDTVVQDRRYLSEDYLFCERWRDIGGEVFVYSPATFRHWGKVPFEGNIRDAWGLGKGEAPREKSKAAWTQWDVAEVQMELAAMTPEERKSIRGAWGLRMKDDPREKSKAAWTNWDAAEVQKKLAAMTPEEREKDDEDDLVPVRLGEGHLLPPEPRTGDRMKALLEAEAQPPWQPEAATSPDAAHPIYGAGGQAVLRALARGEMIPNPPHSPRHDLLLAFSSVVVPAHKRAFLSLDLGTNPSTKGRVLFPVRLYVPEEFAKGFEVMNVLVPDGVEPEVPFFDGRARPAELFDGRETERPYGGLPKVFAKPDAVLRLEVRNGNKEPRPFTAVLSVAFADVSA